MQKACPECWHVFQGNGWDGIDAHWRAKHEDIMPYAEAWPLLRDGKYPVTLNTLMRLQGKLRKSIMDELTGRISRQAKLQDEYDQSLGRKLDKHFAKVAEEFGKVNSRLDKVDSRLGGIEESLSRIEAKLDK